MYSLSLFSDFPETANGASDGDGGRGGVSPGTASDRLPATFAVPNTDHLREIQFVVQIPAFAFHHISYLDLSIDLVPTLTCLFNASLPQKGQV